MRVTRLILGMIGTLFCVTLVLPAVRRLEQWWQIRSGQVFYIEGGYLREGLQWLIWALVALVPILYAALRPRSSPGWLILGFSVALVGMATLPNSYGRFVAAAGGHESQRMTDAGNLLEQWGKNHSRFPATQAELEDALRNLPQPSPFARAGTSLSYRPIFLGATGAAQEAPRAGDQPGMLLYTSRADQREFWLTAESLGPTALGTRPEMLRDQDGKTWVVESQLPDPPPSPAPASKPADRKKSRGGA